QSHGSHRQQSQSPHVVTSAHLTLAGLSAVGRGEVPGRWQNFTPRGTARGCGGRWRAETGAHRGARYTGSRASGRLDENRFSISRLGGVSFGGRRAFGLPPSRRVATKDQGPNPVNSAEFRPFQRAPLIISIFLEFPAFPRRKKVNSVEYAESEG